MPGCCSTARDDPVDELLERDALVVAVSPPHRVVDDLARVVAEAVAEEVLEPARGLVERVALHVEPDVARVGRGQQPEAALLFVGEELEQVAVLAPPSQLQLRLVAGAFEGVGVGVRRKPAGQGRRRQVAKLLQRGDPRGDQRLGLRAPQPCDEREVVVVDALLPAHVPEVADPAVARRPAVRLAARRRSRRGTARGRAGSTPRTRPPGTSRARRARSRRGRARRAGRRCAPPARRRTAAAARGPAWRCARASCRRARSRRRAASRGSRRSRATFPSVRYGW